MGSFEECLSFDDILLVPQFSSVKSRSDIKFDTILKTRHPNISYHLTAPFISAPMDTVTEAEMAFRMKEYGGLGIIHRYNTIEQQIKIVADYWAKTNLEDDPKNANIGAAIGATGDYLERAKALVYEGVNILCVDVAHGHHLHLKNALETLVKELPEHIHIMTGNVATAKAFTDLAEWGANSIRVGIGAGAACSTRIKTGHGVPLFQSLLWIYQTVPVYITSRVTTIADGGIRNGGDVTKAFAVGATAVMMGSLLAGSKASPGGKDNIIISDGKWMKPYRGMASFSAQKDWGRAKPAVEGVSTMIPYTGKVEVTLDEILDGVRSGFSYSGAHNIEEFKQNAVLIKQSVASQNESRPHILK